VLERKVEAGGRTADSEEGREGTDRSASSMTRMSSALVSPTPTPVLLLVWPPLPFLLMATLLLPSRNSSRRPGVPTRMSAPVSKKAFLSSWSELPPMRRSAGAMGGVVG